MNPVYPRPPATIFFRLSHKPTLAGLPFILCFGLAWLLAGCGAQAKSVAVTTATVIVTTPLPSAPTATPTSPPATEPTATPAATPIPMPTVEIDSEAQNFYFKGLTSVAAGLTEEALASFDQAIALQPGYALAYLERGKLYRGQGQLGQAKADFQYALEFTTDPAVKADIKRLLQQVATVPAVTSTPRLDQATPIPQVTITIASAPPIEAHLEQPVSLPLGRLAHFEEAKLTLVFLSVLEDSRCPRQVNCVWSGQARLMIQVQQGGLEATPFELNTNPPLKQATITYAGYDIQLIQIDPYPEAPDPPIPPEAYLATFVVKAK